MDRVYLPRGKLPVSGLICFHDQHPAALVKMFHSEGYLGGTDTPAQQPIWGISTKYLEIPQKFPSKPDRNAIGTNGTNGTPAQGGPRIRGASPPAHVSLFVVFGR